MKRIYANKSVPEVRISASSLWTTSRWLRSTETSSTTTSLSQKVQTSISDLTSGAFGSATLSTRRQKKVRSWDCLPTTNKTSFILSSNSTKTLNILFPPALTGRRGSLRSAQRGKSGRRPGIPGSALNHKTICWLRLNNWRSGRLICLWVMMWWWTQELVFGSSLNNHTTNSLRK